GGGCAACRPAAGRAGAGTDADPFADRSTRTFAAGAGRGAASAEGVPGTVAGDRPRAAMGSASGTPDAGAAVVAACAESCCSAISASGAATPLIFTTGVGGITYGALADGLSKSTMT